MGVSQTAADRRPDRRGRRPAREARLCIGGTVTSTPIRPCPRYLLFAGSPIPIEVEPQHQRRLFLALAPRTSTSTLPYLEPNACSLLLPVAAERTAAFGIVVEQRQRGGFEAQSQDQGGGENQIRSTSAMMVPGGRCGRWCAVPGGSEDSGGRDLLYDRARARKGKDKDKMPRGSCSRRWGWRGVVDECLQDQLVVFPGAQLLLLLLA
ncbi:hypothetical protein F5X96DRAFT_675769 [Biscogniauxia mediterranea]|nr:hypothetical protein F5X96DRAFT_675769 [Biscogniauxia mediterranea]